MATGLAERIRQRHGLKADADVGVKAVLSDVTARPDGLVTAVANTAAVDLVREVVVPEGALRDAQGQPAYFADAKAIYWNHDYAMPPIGTFRNARLTPKGWACQFQMSKLAFAQDVLTLILEGSVNGTSIGFDRLVAGEPVDAEIERYGMADYITRSWRWLELSVTPMPCNPEAWIQGVKSAPHEGFVEAVRKAAERHAIRPETADAMGCGRKKIVVLL